MDQSSVRKFICLVICHMKKISWQISICVYNHTLGSESQLSFTPLVAFIMAVRMKPNSAYFLHVNSFPAKTHKRVQIKD